MTTLQDQLETARLSKPCKIDLMTHTEQIDLENSALPKRPPTYADNDLPAAIFESTVSKDQKTADRRGGNPAAVSRFSAEKTAQTDARGGAMRSTMMLGDNFTYTKQYDATYHDCPKRKVEPFVESRSRDNLSGKDECFVRMYASALTKKPVPREPKDDDAVVAAEMAYKDAFRRFTGREPSAKELEEVDRLHFSFDEHGQVGVIQKPHTCYPHSHITCCNRRCARCANQVYRTELPPVRGARDRFPGPIPVWSSTKNLSTMVCGDMHQPGHQNTSSIKRAALDTVVGPK